MKSSYTFEFHMVLKAPSNMRGHWSKGHARTSEQRKIVRLEMLKDRPTFTLPVKVTLTRIAPRPLDDDNLPNAFKAVRDTIADILVPGKRMGHADSDPRITWVYRQERSENKVQRVRIQLE